MAAALDPSPSVRMEDLLACCICGETLDEPKTLPCFLSLCKRCLARYVEVERKMAERESRNRVCLAVHYAELSLNKNKAIAWNEFRQIISSTTC